MKTLEIQQTELMDLVDEKLAIKNLKALECFFANEINGEKSLDLVLKSTKRGSNKSAEISQELIVLLIKVLKEIANKNAVTIAGKKTRITAQEAMQLIDVSLERFNEMIDEKIIKCHHNKRGYYVHMEDIPKGKKVVRESREEMFKELARDMQAEMAENSS